jgi:hypothetical protein
MLGNLVIFFRKMGILRQSIPLLLLLLLLAYIVEILHQKKKLALICNCKVAKEGS